MRFVILIAGAAACVWFAHHRGESMPAAETRIENGKTSDFSSGRLVVESGATEDAALKKSVSDMDAASPKVTFTPRAKHPN